MLRIPDRFVYNIAGEELLNHIRLQEGHDVTATARVGRASLWDRMWARAPRRLALTRAGKFFVALTLGVGLGALNTGNNLLFLLEGMLLALIATNGVLSEASLRKLVASRRAPHRVHEGVPGRGALRVRNEKRRMPAASVTVHEGVVRCVEGPAAGREVAPERVRFYAFWMSTPSVAERPEAVVAAAHLTLMRPGQELDLPASWRVETRGRYQLTGLVLSTRFPFGLFEKSANMTQPGELWVFPAPLPAQGWRGVITARLGEVPSGRAGLGEDFFELRDWRDGEDRRAVHWKGSARRGKLVTRQFEEFKQQAVEVTLLSHTGRDEEPSPEECERFEQGLGMLTGLLLELGAQGWRLGLRVGGQQRAVAVGEADAQRIEGMLRQLSVVRLRSGPDGALPPSGAARGRAARIVVGLPGALGAEAAADLVLPLEGTPGQGS